MPEVPSNYEFQRDGSRFRRTNKQCFWRRYLEGLHKFCQMSCFLLVFIIYFQLCWVFDATCRLSPVAASSGYFSLWCAGFSLQWLLLLQSTDSTHPVFSSCGLQAPEHRLNVAAHELICSTACGMFLNQELNPCPLHWQADSQPLNHWTTRELPKVSTPINGSHLGILGEM